VKKRKDGKRAATKKSTAPKNFTEYLANVPKPARTMLVKMRGAIRSALPADATETISSRIPTFRSDKGVLVCYAAFADHCSIFPTAAVIEEFKDELAGFSTSKGTIHFPLGKPLPTSRIRDVVKARVKHTANSSK
jgi:uncharacterized protein YdhG (YjbR/CyaY superfamily)